MMRSGTAYQLPTLAHLTAGTACGSSLTLKPTHSVPTPTASDHIERECTSTEALNYETNKSVSLNRWVKMWPTPNASAISNNTNVTCSGDGRAKPNKLGWAVARAEFWPPPTTCMSKGSSPASLTRKDGRDRSKDRLDHAVMASNNGALNPTWVEWLMGFPTEHTDLQP